MGNSSSEPGRLGGWKELRARKKEFIIDEGDLESHRKNIRRLSEPGTFNEEWFMEFTAVPDWTKPSRYWQDVLYSCGKPASIHVDMRMIANCEDWRIPLQALLGAIPRQFGNSPNLFVYVPLENVVYCLQVFALAVLGAGHILPVARPFEIYPDWISIGTIEDCFCVRCTRMCTM